MEISALRIFVKVVQKASFTRAAEVLNTQKAYLSRVVSQLENELGVRLLERTTRSLSLTEVGREFFERAIGILAAVEETERAMQKAQGEPRGELKLTCGTEFGMIAVSTWIRTYLDQFPHTGIKADFTNRVIDIVHEGYDLAIRVGPLPDSSLVARKLGNLEYGVFAAPSYLKHHQKLRQPDDLKAFQILAFMSDNMTPSWTFSRGLEQIKLAFEPRLTANNVFAVRDAALQGLGLAKLPRIVVKEAVKNGSLIEVLDDWSLPSAPVHAVFASSRYLTPKVRAFIDIAVSDMQKVQT